mmetsp:Transcript_58549/g.106672  ORF Transcript_58549/g.106672 Transcript_58549/m.106672 type:complete len:329 (+) Transcript_58549:44-1030(+)
MSQLELLVDDVARVSAQHGVRCDLSAVRGAVVDNAPFFTPDSYIQLRLARKVNSMGELKHQLNFRTEVFSGPGDHRAVGLLRCALASVEEIPGVNACQDKGVARQYLHEVLDAFPTCAVAADFDPAVGLVKLWHFGACTADQLCKLPNTPRALAAYLPFFQKHGFSQIFCTGVDLEKLSMNIYFNAREGGRKDGKAVLAMFHDLGFDQPSDEAMLAYITGPGSFAMTLRWDSDSCERVCFYIVPPLQDTMPPCIRAFMDECGLPCWHKEHPEESERFAAHPMNSCFVSCSFSKQLAGMYFKQESDWQNSYHELLGRCVAFVRQAKTAQ